MEILTLVWEQYLYIPLFNLLIWIYTYYAGFNLGIAIIILTLLIRVVLLPFTILTERGKILAMDLSKEVAEIRADYRNDFVKQKAAVRALLKRRKIRPWAKAVVLGVQGLAIVLLYQVFLGGISTVEKLHLLYEVVPKPDFINTKFLWFNLGEKDLMITGLAAGFIFIEVLIDNAQRTKRLTKKQQVFSILFPAFVFLALALLPAAKSVFVLTSLIFSAIISLITLAIKLALNTAKKQPN